MGGGLMVELRVEAQVAFKPSGSFEWWERTLEWPAAPHIGDRIPVMWIGEDVALYATVEARRWHVGGMRMTLRVGSITTDASVDQMFNAGWRPRR